MEDKRLFLLDAYALIYRAYYAMIRSPRMTTKGLNTSAIFGFVNTLEEVLRKQNPTHIAVCFDPKGDTFRHEAYTEYKAGRDKQPEDITLSLPYIHRILEAYRIPAIEVPGYEADDVIGTLSRHAEEQGFITYMMTPDKDYGQLVTDRVLQYVPARSGGDAEVRGPQQVCDRYGINSPVQVIDLLALEGDASDNIPGCPGVGEKTAVSLIRDWGSVENLLDHTADLRGAIARKVTDNAEKIRFSKFLATIKTDVPIPAGITIDGMSRGEINAPALAEVYRELEFRTFLRRLETTNPEIKGSTAKSAETAAKRDDGFVGSLFDEPTPDGETVPAVLTSLADTPHSFTTASTPAEVAEAVSRAGNSRRVAIALDADGTQPMTASLQAIALSSAAGNAVYIPLPDEDTRRREIAVMLEPLFGKGTTIVSHDIKRDMILLRRVGLYLNAPYYDTSVAHYLLDPEMKHTLEAVAARYLDYQFLLDDAPASDRLCEAAAVTLRLFAKLDLLVHEQELQPLLDDIELPLTAVLADMEWTGVRIDSTDLARLSAEFTSRLEDMEQEIYNLAGRSFNISSPAQVGEVLFDHLQLMEGAKRTKKGSYSTTEEILEKLRPVHPIVDLILRYRALRKLLTTYVNALPALVNPTTGKIHTSYNQTVTATGRISSTNPNLQNIPIRSDDGREIRRAFIPEPGHLIMSADYSQIELRLMADLSGDPTMIEAFLSDADIHRATAAKIYHENIEDVTDTQRRNAKTANFGIIYGISAFGLSERLGIPRSEAKELIEGYLATYPRVAQYMQESIERARTDGFVSTIMGRRRYLPDITSRSNTVRAYAERNAINAPLQGSAADIIKVAMVRIDAEIRRRRLKSRMILQVHDELIFNVVEGELAEMQQLVVEGMENAYHGRVPLTAAAGVADNWLDAH